MRYREQSLECLDNEGPTYSVIAERQAKTAGLQKTRSSS